MRPGLRIAIASGLVVFLLVAGCARQRRFRFVPATTPCFSTNVDEEPADQTASLTGPADERPSLDCRSLQYKMAFIEFDEKGRMFDAKQAEAARRLIEFEKTRATSGKIITVVYIHGWKNNAAEAEPGGKPKDVEKFQGAMLELGYRAAQAAQNASPPREPVPVVGIYIAWRGKTLMGPSWFTAASLWSRRNTANNIGDGDDLGPFLEQVIDLTNRGTDTSRVLLIGHSFGARVLEHAIESKQVRLFDTVAAGAVVRPRVDLVLYVNSANDSRLSMARVQALRDAKLHVRHPDYTPEDCRAGVSSLPVAERESRAAQCRDYPLIVAITSKGDSATKDLLPLANTINGDGLKPELAGRLPPLPTGEGFADPPPSAGQVRKTAAGHFGFLQSHVAREILCPVLPTPSQREQGKTVDEQIDEAVRRAVADALGKPEEARARRLREAAEAERRRVEWDRRFERAMHPVCDPQDPNCRFVFRTLGDTPACYQVDQRQAVNGRPPFNATPFWIMNVEPTVIKDHGDIWNISFIEMLGQLMAPRGFFDPQKGRMQLRLN